MEIGMRLTKSQKQSSFLDNRKLKLSRFKQGVNIFRFLDLYIINKHFYSFETEPSEVR